MLRALQDNNVISGLTRAYTNNNNRAYKNEKIRNYHLLITEAVMTRTMNQLQIQMN